MGCAIGCAIARPSDRGSIRRDEPRPRVDATIDVARVDRVDARRKAIDARDHFHARSRPSRSTPADKVAAHAIDEIVALAGVDRMTIPPPLLQQLAECNEPLPRMLEPLAAKEACAEEAVGGGAIGESDFRMALNADVCATTKMAEGINAFVGETLKLEAAIRSKL